MSKSLATQILDGDLPASAAIGHIEAEAFAAGVEAAKAAASWVVDGNTDPQHACRVLRLLDDGDPEAWDYLPPMPNLGGEWADELTPLSLAREVTGDDEPDAATVGAICDEWERGVSETFEEACERELREFVAVEVERSARMVCTVEGLTFEWCGGEYIDVGYVATERGDYERDYGYTVGEFVAQDCINVWDYASGEPIIDRTLAAFEARCVEYVSEAA